jgi:uncharacterized protein (TIGR00369 family)
MDPEHNRFNTLVRRVRGLPISRRLQQRVLTWSAGFAVPYLSTSSVRFEEVERERAVLSLDNRRSVQNHMKSVHASAMFLLAEAATGVVLSANLPEGSRFATTHIEIDYKQLAVGGLQAVASLTTEQRELLRSQEKGRLSIPVKLTDANGNEPASFVIEWSWKHRVRR